MPKEIVHSRSGKFDIEISWDGEPGRDGEVQIGIATRDSAQTLAEALPPEARAYGSAAAAPTPQEDGRLLGDFRGIYGQFDRASLNRTIRLLRKARDHVYGRDE